MADVAPTTDKIRTFGENVHVITWTPLTSANAAGTAVQMPGSADRTVQITGTFDSATVVMQGSLDGTNWFTLGDPQGNTISKTSAALEAISELVRYIRPSTSGGGGTQSLTVMLLMRRP
jgi:hypothetical protein